jgi:pimeloyl-ACP methyl ester carboxylesterase
MRNSQADKAIASRWAALVFALASPAGAQFRAAPVTEPVPPAVISDPVADPADLPRMIMSPMPSHGTNIPAMFYTAGPGRHPTLILFTGLPGAEINSDLIYAARRDGWNVVTFHYRGSWGTPGKFSLGNCLEDGAAAVAWVRNPGPQLASFVDPARIVVGGHSTGGWVAAYVAAHDPSILGAALISGAYPSISHGAPRDQLLEFSKSLIEVAGMQLLNATPDELADEQVHADAGWELGPLGKAFGHRSTLVVTANDRLQPFDDEFADTAVKAGARVTRTHFDTNHGYNDRRIALAATLVRWLDTIVAPQ